MFPPNKRPTLSVSSASSMTWVVTKMPTPLSLSVINSFQILDEPTVGIDPSLRKKIWKELFALRDNGVGILVTTHVMNEAELTDKVGLLLGGKIIAFDTPQHLKESYQVSSIEEVFLKAEGE